MLELPLPIIDYDAQLDLNPIIGFPREVNVTGQLGVPITMGRNRDSDILLGVHNGSDIAGKLSRHHADFIINMEGLKYINIGGNSTRINGVKQEIGAQISLNLGTTLGFPVSGHGVDATEQCYVVAGLPIIHEGIVVAGAKLLSVTDNSSFLSYDEWIKLPIEMRSRLKYEYREVEVHVGDVFADRINEIWRTFYEAKSDNLTTLSAIPDRTTRDKADRHTLELEMSYRYQSALRQVQALQESVFTRVEFVGK